MILPTPHLRELERVQTLKNIQILDTVPEIEYDNLTEIAAKICNTPIALVSLLDEKRQWFKSHCGLDATETPKDFAFCAHAINHDGILIVEDSRNDERFIQNPLVENEPHVIFYAGVPLIEESGLPLGTLCVIDHEPRQLNDSQIKSLYALAKQVVNNLNLRKRNLELNKLVGDLEKKNKELNQFAYLAAHDLKSPLQNLSGISNLVKYDKKNILTPDSMKMIDLMESSVSKLGKLINGLLECAQTENIMKENLSKLNIKKLINELILLTPNRQELTFKINSSFQYINVNETAIKQILLNLISNASKYNNKLNPIIEINVEEDNNHYSFAVSDNGPGITYKNQLHIFEKFNNCGIADRNGEFGNGIGLNTVKCLVEKLNGQISVESELGKGATFIFTIGK